MNADDIQRMLDFFVLKTLAQEPMGCFELERRMEKKTGGIFQNRISFSKALERMESAGWVYVERPEGARTETVYSVTPAGREQLQIEAKRQQSALAKLVDEGKWPAYRSDKARPGSSN